MTVTAEYAAEHFQELAAAAMQGSEVCITGAGGAVLDLRARPMKVQADSSLIDEEGNRKFGALPAPMTWNEWQAIERDWDENVIPNLWMNRDDTE